MRNMVDEASCLAKRGGTPRLLWITKDFCKSLMREKFSVTEFKNYKSGVRSEIVRFLSKRI